MENKNRCAWAKKPAEIEYHDKEWGVPEYDDKKLFEFLILESFQAGLAWHTILKKRENFRKAFDDFDYNKIADYSTDKINQLITNPEIIRNKKKIEAAVKNALVFKQIQREFGSFKNYFWSFSNFTPIINRWKDASEVPAKTSLSDKISKDMKQKGFTFFGSTICYAFMQAVGMVNDHEMDCFRYNELLNRTNKSH
ncbi:MAG: DNA-3-methyladenine glycosylase I [Bacteroidales bacterium]